MSKHCEYCGVSIECHAWECIKKRIARESPEATTSEARGEYNPMLPRCNEKGEMPTTKYEDEMMNHTTRVHCPACGKMVTNCEHGVSSVFVENCSPTPMLDKLLGMVEDGSLESNPQCLDEVMCPRCGPVTPRTAEPQYCPSCRVKFPCDVQFPSLSLLVIDLGDSCVVKAEQGRWSKYFTEVWGTADDLCLVHESFDKVKSAIDAMEGDKPPIPRLECPRNSGYVGLDVVMLNHVGGEYRNAISQDQYDALCELAGVKIPIWTGGQWEDLTVWKGMNDFPIGAWRYRRD